MKRLLLLLAAVVCTSLHAQDVRQHTVQRGETFAVIARRYGLTEDEVKAANPNHSVCYVGLKLQIPAKPTEAPAETEGEPLAATATDETEGEAPAKRRSSRRAFWKGVGDFIVGMAEGMNESGLLEETGEAGALIGSTADLVNSVRGEESHYGDVAAASRAESYTPATSDYGNSPATANADMNALQQQIDAIDRRINEIGEEQVRLLREKKNSHAKMVSSAGTAVKVQTGSNLTRNFSASRARRQAQVRAQAQAPYRNKANNIERQIRQLDDEKYRLMKEKSQLSQQLADLQGSMDTYADNSYSDSSEERSQEQNEKSKQTRFEANNKRSYQNQIFALESNLVDRRSDPERFLNGGETPSQFAREVRKRQNKIKKLLNEFKTKSGGVTLPHDESLLRWNP